MSRFNAVLCHTFYLYIHVGNITLANGHLTAVGPLGHGNNEEQLKRVEMCQIK